VSWIVDSFHSYSTALPGLAAAMLTGAAVLASLPRYPVCGEDRIFSATPQPAA